MYHKPVLLQEVLRESSREGFSLFWDATCGEGGHALSWLRENPQGKLLASDKDREILQKAKKRIEKEIPKDRISFLEGSYAEFPFLTEAPYDFILLDLGFSTYHIQEAKRGFSFEEDSILDMRYSVEKGKPAWMYINRLPEERLREIFYLYGEEPLGGEIAKEIIIRREKFPIKTSHELRILCENVYFRRKRKAPLRKVLARIFQALRIYVNKELEELEKFLRLAPPLLKPGGKLLIISFHSLEARLVKRYFREWEKKGGFSFTKKYLPTKEEIRENPFSSSSSLRILQRIS